jgi:hypothetical protein
VLRRWPFVLPFAVLACIAARIHVHVGSTEANLLVPMYAVVAAAALLLAVGAAPGRHPRARSSARWPGRLLPFVAWSGVSILWTQDLRQGSIDLLFFYLPFGLLAIVLARLAWSRLIAVGLLVELTAMALVFSAIGIYQYETRDVFWNPKLLVSNAFRAFYRVNSVFWDPSIYGRFLVVAILALLVAVLFTRDRRVLLGATAAIAGIWAGLYFSYSHRASPPHRGVVLAAVFAWGRRGLVLAIVDRCGRRARRPSRCRACATTSSATTRRARQRPRHARAAGLRTSPSTTRLPGVGIGGSSMPKRSWRA